MKVSQAEGRVLDWMVAKCEGYIWAKNMSERYGDNDRRDTPQWPVGARIFVGGDRKKALNKVKKNWDGYCISNGRERIAPAALYYVNHYSTHWIHGGPIIDREISCITDRPDDTRPCAWSHRGLCGQMGDTILQASMRCYVISVLGNEVVVPKGIEICL